MKHIRPGTAPLTERARFFSFANYSHLSYLPELPDSEKFRMYGKFLNHIKEFCYYHRTTPRKLVLSAGFNDFEEYDFLFEVGTAFTREWDKEVRKVVFWLGVITEVPVSCTLPVQSFILKWLDQFSDKDIFMASLSYAFDNALDCKADRNNLLRIILTHICISGDVRGYTTTLVSKHGIPTYAAWVFDEENSKAYKWTVDLDNRQLAVYLDNKEIFRTDVFSTFVEDFVRTITK